MDDELSRFEQNVDASAFYDGDGDGDVYPENEYLAPADGSSHTPFFSSLSQTRTVVMCACSQEAALGS
jgi:hypothetical protein